MRGMTKAISKTNANAAMLCVAIGWLAFTVLTGCATTPSTDTEVSHYDPFESVNRRIHGVNDFVDRKIAKPVTQTYVSYTPRPIRHSVSHFFDNVVYPSVILNDFLQGKGTQGLDDLGRFLVNTTFGFLGVWDMATPLGLEAHDEDFGQTLAVWGMDESTYLVLPFLGPTTVRDAPNLGVTAVTNILFYVPNPYAVPIALLGFIDYRAGVDEAVTFRDETAVEPYLFTREAYLQHRRFLIYDGKPPVDDDLFLDDPFVDLDVQENPSQKEPGNARVSSDRNE